MPTVLDRYFELSDVAGTDEGAFAGLMALFADDATLHPNGVAAVHGPSGIAEFFSGFLSRNAELRHVWTVTPGEGGLIAQWAVAGRRNTGEVFALAGVDVAELDPAGKIKRLEVKANQS
ncbi:nuclear transport factor 2 family protein [Streptomyces sp. NPDC052396]|uniref:nuclear transport factor 2 family protein n=1 Tax=Streptomyces sp. NPDC052396 TaxID=3365689 RepID=UPI0037CD953E